jgi:complement component 1 Q subcomponent-binding protein
MFTIDEMTMYEGEWTEKNYSVAGDILDGQLYDLFMVMLDERGVTQEFADQGRDSPIFLQFFYLFSIFFPYRF